MARAARAARRSGKRIQKWCRELLARERDRYIVRRMLCYTWYVAPGSVQTTIPGYRYTLYSHAEQILRTAPRSYVLLLLQRHMGSTE